MIDLDIYVNTFEKFSFEIHEYIETKKMSKLCNLLVEIRKSFPKKCNIKYTTGLGDIVRCERDFVYDQTIYLQINDIMLICLN